GAILAGYLADRDGLRAADVDVVADEIALVSLFADVAELSRNRPAGVESTELRVHSDREHFHRYLQSLDVERAGLPEQFKERLARALAHYGVNDLTRGTALEEAVFRIFLAQQRIGSDLAVITALLERWMGDPQPTVELAAHARSQLERLVRATQRRFPAVGDLARSIRFRWFDQPQVDRERNEVLQGVASEVSALADDPDAPDRQARMVALAAIPEQIAGFLAERLARGALPVYEPMLEVLIMRHYTEYGLHGVQHVPGPRALAVADYRLEGRPTRIISSLGGIDELNADSDLSRIVAEQVAQRRASDDAVVELYLRWPGAPEEASVCEELNRRLTPMAWVADVRRVVIGVCPVDGGAVNYFSFRWFDGSLAEDYRTRGMHPMVGRRLDLWRLRDFDVTRIPAPQDVLLFECVAKSNPADRRLIAMAQVRQIGVVRGEDGRLIGVPHAERAVENCLEAIRRARTARGSDGKRLDTNHVWVHVWPVIDIDLRDITALQAKITPLSEGAGIEEVVAQGRFTHPEGGVRPMAIRFHSKPGAGVTATVEGPPSEPLKPLDEYSAKVLGARRRGLVYPYELSDVLAGPGGTLTEYDLNADGKLVPVDRAPGLNKAGIICAVVQTPTRLYPEGLKRVVLSGDPTRGLGAVAEPECARVMAALDLAEELGVPVEWFTLSSGARISMDSGTENMDWVGAALRRIIEFTQAGGEINVVVAGINVGAQPYWNAEATMLMHTKGILVMTPDSAMVLTGKQSLDFSGGVSAEDNFGIGGYDRVMGPNGQAQYWAPDLRGAFMILMAHYDHTYVLPGEPGPRRAATSDPSERDVSSFPHVLEGSDFTTVGDIFSAASNPDRKKAFDIRTVMAAVCDVDHRPLERWAGMADADTAVVMDARIGGFPVCLLGVESKPVPRRGFPPTDGPDTYTAGTLFPRSSKKAARAINAASGNRPLVVLANLSGFDGSPESMRNLQLEYGAEIGRAIVNFNGPIVFVVISRYHGGAFVVFSKRLNENMTVLAVEGSYASVIGGAPAAAVVFAGDVNKRAAADPRVKALEARIAAASQAERAALRLELTDLRAGVRAEKISEVASEFDGVHDIHRAVRVGSVDKVIQASDLRPEIIAALEK
ncbi:MAG: carboxyl transferase domain-containing protein, partial [Micropruina sp.]